MPPKKPRQSAPPPTRTPVLSGKKKPRVSAPAAVNFVPKKRKSEDSGSDCEEMRTVKRKVSSGEGDKGKERGAGVSRKDGSDEDDDEEDVDGEHEDGEEEEEESGENLDQSQSQSQRHVEGVTNIVANVLAEATKAKGGKKRVERDRKGASKMGKLEGIYSKAEDVFAEIKEGDMGPAAKKRVVDDIFEQIEADLGSWKTSQQKLHESIAARSAAMRSIANPFKVFFAEDRAPFLEALDQAIKTFEHREDKVIKSVRAFQQAQQRKITQGEEKLQESLEARSLIRAARKFVNYHAKA